MPDIAVLIGEPIFDAAITGIEAPADLLPHMPERELQGREVCGDAVEDRIGRASEFQKHRPLAIAVARPAVAQPLHVEFVTNPAIEFCVDPMAKFLCLRSDYCEVDFRANLRLA